ncbi:MAG: hypothetical protein JXK04_08285 [Campylobacterales bacterium]|nr:hypothetical protein [Campylobacterales bacterium]
MTFLHSEFFLWMLLPVGVLFYFWQTQKPFENRWLSEVVLRKLRAPELTMGLKGRNTLFLIASVLLIAAMAQPVLLEPLEHAKTKARIVFALQTGTQSEAEFEKIKKVALEAMGTAAGHEMAVVAFDEKLYRISPLSDDYPILSLLVRNLTRTGEKGDVSKTLSVLEGMKEADVAVVVAAEGVMEGTGRVIVLEDESGIALFAERLREFGEAERLSAHIPLFQYPLGLAMILIWIALSSMSRRRSVTVAALMAVVGMTQPPAAHAGFFDFGLLHEAREAYERGEYSRSAALFGRYQQSHDSAQVRYNRASALYKAGRYGQAEFWYRHVYTDDPVLEKQRRYNLEQTRKQMALQRKIPEAENPAQKVREDGRDRRGEVARRVPDFTTRLYTFP